MTRAITVPVHGWNNKKSTDVVVPALTFAVFPSPMNPLADALRPTWTESHLGHREMTGRVGYHPAEAADDHQCIRDRRARRVTERVGREDVSVDPAELLQAHCRREVGNDVARGRRVLLLLQIALGVDSQAEVDGRVVAL